MSEIDREVKIHSQVEEEIFYPAFKEAARSKRDRELFFEAKEEHHVVDLAVAGLLRLLGYLGELALRSTEQLSNPILHVRVAERFSVVGFPSEG
jgi:hypothetical protein